MDETTLGLRALNGPLTGRVTQICQSECTIGRSRSCDVRLDRPSVSRKHCIVKSNGTGITVQDLESQFGTFVNGRRVKEVSRLTPGDQLKLGNQEFEFFVVSSNGSVATTAPTTEEESKTEEAPQGPEGSSDMGHAIGDFDAPDHPGACLRALSGKQAGQIVRIPGLQGLMGRSRSCQCRMQGATISRKHCAFRKTPDGISIRDLDSRHGTFINDQKIQNETIMFPGDRLRLGELQFEFVHPLNSDEFHDWALSSPVAENSSLDAVSISGSMMSSLGGQLASPTIAARVEDDALVVSLLLQDVTDKQLLKRIHDEMAEQLPQAKKMLVIDCVHLVGEVQADFWKMLVYFRKQLAEADVPVRLCRVDKKLHKELSNSTFSRLFSIYDSPKEAITDENRHDAKPAEKADRPKMGESFNRFLFGLDRLSPQIAALVAGFCIVLLGVAVMLSNLVFSGSTPSGLANQAIWDNAKSAAVTGSASFVEGKDVLPEPEAGAAILAWPANVLPKAKHSISSADLFQLEQQRSLSTKGPFMGRVGPSGMFQLTVAAPLVESEYFVLVLSQEHLREQAQSINEKSLLALYFTDPQGLIGPHVYSLQRISISPNQTVSLEIQLQP